MCNCKKNTVKNIIVKLRLIRGPKFVKLLRGPKCSDYPPNKISGGTALPRGRCVREWRGKNRRVSALPRALAVEEERDAISVVRFSCACRTKWRRIESILTVYNVKTDGLNRPKKIGSFEWIWNNPFKLVVLTKYNSWASKWNREKSHLLMNKYQAYNTI